MKTYSVGESIKHKKTPIITIVLECNRELTGVGAAIALINHDAHGN